MKIKLTHKTKELHSSVHIPSSKSISNRVQIINALSYSFARLKNLSRCDDSKAIESVLMSNTNQFDIGHSGTAMRFLTAYLSKIVGEWTITGSARMQTRPIGELVDALNSLGAQITYLGEEGYPPLKIFGSNLTGESVKIKADVSSQFISALMLIAPSFEKGLKIELEGELVSGSYIELTQNVMRDFGVDSSFKNNIIKIPHRNYNSIDYKIESDWSSASYWFLLLSCCKSGNITLTGLNRHSFQGDSKQLELWTKLGVNYKFSKKGLQLSKTNISVKQLKADFINMPDLAQSFVVSCIANDVNFHFKGLKTLKIKETNRIDALIIELKKLGYVIHEPADGELAWSGERIDINKAEEICISTYDDHRMAMAFSAFCLKYDNINIENPDVVGKSYPEYWNDLQEAGFVISENID
ncbi:MAG: 3-phosphoshikimate 1-carboxyvinyltransferase [Marinifilaceae bacterium]|jgi:3-phosphoshikimate 1-carboxyvinyltransferase|nr:3-phosphoshikimate 1-carboxyvinyltransferase [Marinifilaceae bacterium]